MLHAWWFWVLVAYVCGSIPFGLLLGKARGVDIRQLGSKNIGATNVGRVLGRKWGFLCFGLDVLKGAAPVLAAGLVMGVANNPHLTARDAWPWLGVAAAAMVGHVFPVWLKFKGGKGVATGFGVLLGVWPILTLAGVAALGTWIVLVAAFRYVSLASLAAAAMLPLFLVVEALIRGVPLTERVPFLVVTGLMAILVVVRHRTNIGRLLAGTESKIGRKQREVTGAQG